jgi:hypothetical protein
MLLVCCAGRSPSSPDVTGTISAISAASSAGLAVYVIGIGPSVGNLDMFAGTASGVQDLLACPGMALPPMPP